MNAFEPLLAVLLLWIVAKMIKSGNLSFGFMPVLLWVLV